ncbi:protein PLASTID TRANSCRIPTIONALLY ACTIVE 7-like isoform X1 [Musa acuminata AAA Group]|uniref:protein PLASTID TRANSCRIPTIONALLY ACTIVE 7 isoform X1 n=1 Tax=Musa acuminata AAA Group TaxID=214697 RepID=UPI0031E24AB2
MPSPGDGGAGTEDGAASPSLLDPRRLRQISGSSDPSALLSSLLDLQKDPFFVFWYQDSGEGGNRRRIWRRRRLTKNDDKLRYKMDRIPFLEEQVRKIRENGKVMSMDIEKLMLSEENRFDFVNEVAAEATSYIEANRDEYGSKKAILHVLSNRMNEAGFERPEAYMEEDPFRPGPSYLKELDT